MQGFKGTILSVGAGATHGFSKPPLPQIELIAGLGVLGDTHAGATVRHRSRVAKDPTQPNLRQVHLLQAELLEDLADRGFLLAPGDIGENVLTQGIDLLDLPVGTLLHLGSKAVVEVTGLRNPCRQLNDFMPGLMQAVLDKDAAGRPAMKGGVMAVVRVCGRLRPGDFVRAEAPAEPHRRLQRV